MSVKIIDLGMHPHADTFVREEQLGLSEPVLPLECFLNKETGAITTGVQTSAHDRYIAYDYSYTSSNSKFAKEHWLKFADSVSRKVDLCRGSKVVEIGSNDGFLTKQFKDMGCDTLGVDPSEYMTKLASQLGVETFCEFFTSPTSEVIVRNFGQADLVIANNVLNHSNDVEDFILAVSNLLKEDSGVFVFELPYWYYTIKDRKFDQIYHEHVTYFTVKYAYELLSKYNMEISDVEVVEYHGGSLRVFASKKRTVSKSEKVKQMIFEEEQYGLFTESTYVEFMKDLFDERSAFLRKIHNLKLEGCSIVGVGAPAKGNTLLNFYKLDNSVIDYITDASPHKQGKFTPLSRIPIVGDEIFSQYDEVYAVVLSWNISDLVKEKLREINNKIVFLECKPL